MFGTVSDRFGPREGDSDQSNNARQYVLALDPEDKPDNDYTEAADPAEYVFERFGALHQVCYDAKTDVYSTFGYSLA